MLAKLGITYRCLLPPPIRRCPQRTPRYLGVASTNFIKVGKNESLLVN